jgi:F-type H+-transporting ATPase subunit b
MRFDWLTFALQTINFVILVWLLRRFLHQPVLNLIDARKAEIQKQYNEADAIEAQAKARLEETKSERAGVAAEREQMLKRAAEEGAEAAKGRIARADQEAAALLDSARKTLAAERAEALGEARRAALDLGADIARRLLAEMPVKLRAEAWLERIEQHLSTLPEDERNRLLPPFSEGASLTVATASPLPEEVMDEWRDRLRRSMGDHLVITFRPAPELVAGVELHFPASILRFSWRSELAALRSGIEAGEQNHDNPQQ